MSVCAQAAINASRPAGVFRSPATARTQVPVALEISSATVSSRLASRPLIVTTQPSRASAVAQARPRPCDEAQTSAVLPAIPRSTALPQRREAEQLRRIVDEHLLSQRFSR